MKYHKQEHLVRPELGDVHRQIGSCYPTVLACLLDKELHEVPYFHLLYFQTMTWKADRIRSYFEDHYLNGYTEKEYPHKDYHLENYERADMWTYWLWDRVREYWLLGEGYTEEYIPSEKLEEWLRYNPNRPYMAHGLSPRKVGHVVIHMNGKMIHDPHPSDAGVAIDKGTYYTYLRMIGKTVTPEMLLQYAS